MQIISERDFVVRRWSDFKDFDWWLLGSVIALLIFDLFLLKSASSEAFVLKQFLFTILAFFLGTAVLFININFWQKISLWIYVFNVFLLLVVLFMGTSAMGAQRWIDFGIVKIQPSEIAKVGILISLAAWFLKHPIKNYFDILNSFFIIAIPVLLILKQPDLGTSLVFISIYLGMAFWAGASVTHLLICVSPVLSLILNATGDIIYSFGTFEFNNKIIELTVTNSFLLFMLFLLLWLIINYKVWRSPWLVLWISTIVFLNFIIGFIRPVLWSMLQLYQQRRLTIFLNPESDPQGAGYHIIQSLLAVGNGGLFGYGWQNGRLTRGDYIPAQHTDFIFSTLGEEFGFIGAVIVICLFAIILSRILVIAKDSNNKFASFLAIGIFSFFAFHIFVNIGMTVGIMPITGVPLPFLSYGGTALVVDTFSIFLLLSVSWRTLPRKIF